MEAATLHFRVVLDASVEVRSAITYATVINGRGDVPVFFLQGLSGSSSSRSCSRTAGGAGVDVVALTVPPALAVLLSKGRLRDARVPCASSQRGYGAILER